MKRVLANLLEDFSHLFFPHNCAGCGSDTLPLDGILCAECSLQLPKTGFFLKPENTIERIFYGRINIALAGSAFYFSKESLLHQLIIALKYQGNKKAGNYLGKLLGNEIQMAERFDTIDLIIPLPLNERKEKKRGYNQAMIIAEGIAEIIHKPVLEHAVIRKVFTETQTHKNRISRWQNMEGVFEVAAEQALSNKHVLLVDDVITTGATLEACGAAILKTDGAKLSIATVAYTV